MPGGPSGMVTRRATQLLLLAAAAAFVLVRLAGIAGRPPVPRQEPLRHWGPVAFEKPRSIVLSPTAVRSPVGASTVGSDKSAGEEGGERGSLDTRTAHPESARNKAASIDPTAEDEAGDAGSGRQPVEGGQSGAATPRVALIFLTTGIIPTEPVWRAFLEAAGALQLKAEAPAMTPVNLEELVKGPLKPEIPTLDEERYPGYKIQHGMVPPSRYRQTQYPHVRRRNLQLQDFPFGTKVWDALSQARDEAADEVNPRPPGSKGSGWWTSTQRGCPGEEHFLRETAKRVNATGRGPQIYEGQDLFSIYVHASPGFNFPEDSLFSGREVSNPVNLTNAFALHALVAAEIRILEEALGDTRNQKFVLLSDSCVPVHPPEVVYAQLMYERKSRINACVPKDQGSLALDRWKSKMETPQFRQDHWRKSQQWWVLSREHAELVVADRHVKEIFKRYCWSFGKHICVSDEHYIPTLLASYGLDSETDCFGRATYTDWSVQAWHPRTFLPKEISPLLIQMIQKQAWPPCDPFLARRSALELFDRQGKDDTAQWEYNLSSCMTENGTVEMEQSLSSRESDTAKFPGDGNWVSRAGYLPLGYECPLFARKFAANATSVTFNAILSCSGGAVGDWCPTALMASERDALSRGADS